MHYHIHMHGVYLGIEVDIHVFQHTCAFAWFISYSKLIYYSNVPSKSHNLRWNSVYLSTKIFVTPIVYYQKYHDSKCKQCTCIRAISICDTQQKPEQTKEQQHRDRQIFLACKYNIHAHDCTPCSYNNNNPNLLALAHH